MRRTTVGWMLCLLLMPGCGGDSEGRREGTPAGGFESAAEAAQALVAAAEGKRWEDVARAILPAQRQAVAAWIAMGSLNHLFVMDNVAEPLGDPVARRSRLEEIWSREGVSEGFLARLRKWRDEEEPPRTVSHLASLIAGDLEGSDGVQLMADGLAFEQLLLQDEGASDTMGSFGRAALATEEKLGRMPEELRQRIAQHPPEGLVATGSALLAATREDGRWFMKVIMP